MKGEKGDSGLPGPQGPSVSPWWFNVHGSQKTLKWASYSPTSAHARWLTNSRKTMILLVCQTIEEVSVSLLQEETKVSQRSELEAIFQRTV